MKKLFTLFAMMAIVFGLEARVSNHSLHNNGFVLMEDYGSRCEDASANAGADATICENIAIELYGQAENYTSILWESSGDGTFENAATLETIYYPGSGDIATGNTELCLTAFAEEPCEDATDCLNLTIQKDPIVNAGEDVTICEGSLAQLDGSTEYSSGVFWDFAYLGQGDGTFSSQIIENPIYTPGPDDIELGYVELVLVAFPNAPCQIPETDVMTIDINWNPLVDAGEDMTICEGSSAELDGWAEFSSGVFWDFAFLGQGDGTFSSQIIENPVYTPGPDDIDRGYVELVLLAFPIEPCQIPEVDVMTIYITRQALADAGEDVTVCEGISAQLDGSAEFSSGVFWDFAYLGQGDGTFSSQIIENPIYTPGPDDIELGYVELVLVAFPIEPCQIPGADVMTIDINWNPLVDAGEDMTICASSSAELDGWAEFSSGVFWDFAFLGQGDGTFSSQIIENPVYTPGPDDIERGYVELVLLAFPIEPCQIPGIDVMTIYINWNPLVDAGEDITIFEGSSAQLDGSTECSSGVFWDFAFQGQGDGTFSSQIIENPVYTPGPDDIDRGYVELVLVAFPIAPNQIPGIDAMTIYITPVTALVQGLSLNEGWNGISLYLEPLDPVLDSLYNPIINDVIIMQNLTEVFWPEYGINTIGNWDINTGYAVKMEAGHSLEVYGLPLNTHTINLQPGWHYLPVLTNNIVSTSDLFAPVIDDIVIVKELIGTKVFWPQAGVFSLAYLNPGQSYSIKNSGGISLSFPEYSKMSVTASQPTSSTNSVWGIVRYNPGSHVVLFDENILSELHEKDQIGAFDANNHCFGVLAYDSPKGNKVMSLIMDDPTTPEKDGFTENDALEFKLWDSRRAEEYLLDISFDQTMPNPNLVFNNYGLSAITQMEILTTDVLEFENNINVHLAPNPATTEVFIISDNAQPIKVEFLNQLGKKCLSADVKGTKTTIDISSLSPGVYLVILKTDQSNVVKKLVVK